MAAGTIFFESSTTTAITPTFSLPINGALPFGHTPEGWFETAVGESLTVTSAGAGAIFAVHVVYVTY